MRLKISLDPYYTKPSILSSTPVVILIIVLLYILLSKISLLSMISPANASPIFLAAGFALASVLIFGRKALIGIWIGSLYTNLLLNVDIANLNKKHFLAHLPLGFFISIGTVIASITGAIIVTRLCKKEHPLSNGQNMLTLLILGPISYSTIASLIGVTCFTVNGSISTEQFWHTYKTWWLGDSIGIILITPFMLSWFLKDSFNKNNFSFFELTLCGLATILLCYGVFFHYHDLKYLILPLLFWSAYRFGIQITTFFIIVISLFAIKTTAQGIGPFNKEHINDSILFLDFFLSVITICSLFLAGIIFERKKAENLIKTSEKKLRENQILLESTLESPKDISIYSIGRNYEYLSFNSQHRFNMKSLYGIDIILGMKLQDCLSDKDYLNETTTILNKVFLGENLTMISHFDTINSSWELRISPIVNQKNEIVGATIISTNITEKIKAEEALRKSEEKYRNIIENLQDLFFQTAIDGTILESSPSAQQLLGFSKEELIGQSIINFYNDRNQRETLTNLLLCHGFVKDFEFIITTKSGVQKYVSLDARLICDTNGKPHHIDGFVRDISFKKADELKISEQNIKLHIQNKELEQFAYITSHDLQEPLLTLKCFSELLKEDFPTDLNEEINQYLAFILESSDRMQKLVKGLLDYSRTGAHLEVTTVDCNAIVTDAIFSLSDLIKECNTQINTQNLPQIEGHSAELIQLFQHLISNSIKFRKKETSLLINISVKAVEENWLFSLEDNGIGIEEKNKEKIFIIFKRLNNRDDYPGIGIGLAICKKIIELHGGNIWIESKLGQGTTINFTIPKK